MYLLGIIHAPPGSQEYAALPDGYDLSLQQLEQLEKRVVGVPLTVEHNGIHDAVDAASHSGTVDVEVRPGCEPRHLRRVPAYWRPAIPAEPPGLSRPRHLRAVRTGRDGRHQISGRVCGGGSAGASQGRSLRDCQDQPAPQSRVRLGPQRISHGAVAVDRRQQFRLGSRGGVAHQGASAAAQLHRFLKRGAPDGQGLFAQDRNGLSKRLLRHSPATDSSYGCFR